MFVHINDAPGDEAMETKMPRQVSMGGKGVDAYFEQVIVMGGLPMTRATAAILLKRDGCTSQEINWSMGFARVTDAAPLIYQQVVNIKTSAKRQARIRRVRARRPTMAA